MQDLQQALYAAILAIASVQRHEGDVKTSVKQPGREVWCGDVQELDAHKPRLAQGTHARHARLQ